MKKLSGNQPPFTLSIVSHEDAGKVERLLDSLYRHECADLFQVIITDNLGDDVPEIKGPEWQSLRIIRNKKPLGFARNHNQASQLAIGKYFCVLNPDVLFEQEVFSPLSRWLEGGQADIVVPLVVDADAIPQDSFRDFPTPFEIIQRRLPGYHFTPPSMDNAGLVRPDWVAGIFMLMRSATYHGIKGFDERYRLYFEDVDFCARARLAGLKLIVDTNIRVWHDAQRASRNKLIYLLWHIQSAIRFFTSPVYKQVFQRSK